MATATILIAVDADDARRFVASPPEERPRVEVLFGLRWRELTAGRKRALPEIRDEIGDGDAAQGLTAEAVGRYSLPPERRTRSGKMRLRFLPANAGWR